MHSNTLKAIPGGRLDAIKSFQEMTSFDSALSSIIQLLQATFKVNSTDCDRFLEITVKMKSISANLYESLLPLSFEGLDAESERYKLLIKLKFIEGQTCKLSKCLSQYRETPPDATHADRQLHEEIIDETQYLSRNLERIEKSRIILVQELAAGKIGPKSKYYRYLQPQTPHTEDFYLLPGSP